MLRRDATEQPSRELDFLQLDVFAAHPGLYAVTDSGEAGAVNTGLRCLIALMVFALPALRVWGGGSGLNVVVVVNQNSTNSLQLGNYYCEKRGVPAQNVLRINWTGDAINWTRAEMDSILRGPLNAMLTSRGLSNQIEYVVLSMDIPYRVGQSGGVGVFGTNSTTSALFYGFKPDGACPSCPSGYPGCGIAPASANAYAGSESSFRLRPPLSTTSNSWLTMMLTSSNLPDAKALVDRGVVSDYTFPTQRVQLIHFDPITDPFRGLRYTFYNDAILDCRVRGGINIARTNSTGPAYVGYQQGSQFGLTTAVLPPGLFAPGAMADILTSFSGFIFEDWGHTHALNYIMAGATASYGTLIEPCLYFEKFSSPRIYFTQARGFNVAECYYQGLTNPYQGILLGEPLAAPFALPASGAWSNLPPQALLTGLTNLSLGFAAASADRPVQQVDLFLDGRLLGVVTNLGPRPFNAVYVTLNGFQTNYVLAASPTLQTVASNLAGRINEPTYANLTKVTAFARGDRVELRSMNTNVAGGAVTCSVSNHIGSASLLTTRLTARPTFVDSTAQGYVNFVVTNAALADSFLQLTVTKTNGAAVSIIVSNNPTTDTGGLVQRLFDAVNSNGALAAGDGVIAEDFFSYNTWYALPAGEFNLLARRGGLPDSFIKAELTGSPNFIITPAGNGFLQGNLEELRPRNHLYVLGGFTNVPLTFTFDSTTNADGYHELTAVAYEGSHVRTQKRITQSIRIANSPLSASFTTLLGGSNTALAATLAFRVTANTNDASINRIELFSTGGQWGVVSNLATATFSLPATNLHLGLHPVYALVTRADGKQYRTETKWIRIVDTESAFPVAVVAPPPTLAWPALAGRRYEIRSTTNLAQPFALRDAVVPTNSSGLWSETNGSAPYRFYRLLSVP